MAAWPAHPPERRSQQPTAQAKGWQQTVSWRCLPAANPHWTAGIAPVPRSSGGPNESGLGHCFPDHDEIRAKRTDFIAVWQASLRQKVYLTDGRDDRAHPPAVRFIWNAAAGRTLMVWNGGPHDRSRSRGPRWLALVRRLDRSR